MVKAGIEVFTEKKIILSSITPRQDDHNGAIFDINEEIHKRIKERPNFIHVYNGNLQNPFMTINISTKNLVSQCWRET